MLPPQSGLSPKRSACRYSPPPAVAECSRKDTSWRSARSGLYFTELGKEYFDRADVVLAVGSRLEDFSTGGWQLWPKRARLIQIDFDPEAIHLNQEPEVALVGDAALALDDVIAALPPCAPPTRDRRLHRLAEKRTPFLARAEAEAKKTRTPILTRQVVGAINRIFSPTP